MVTNLQSQAENDFLLWSIKFGQLGFSLQLDPDFVAGVVEEDLRLDKVNWEPAGSSSDSDHEEAVCPRELSLRLHEVIESRLEARIMELETALGASQKRVHSMDFEHVKSKRDFNEFNRETQRSL